MTITSFRNALFILFAITLSGKVLGQDTVYVYDHDKKIDFLSKVKVIHTELDLTPQEALEKIYAEGETLQKATIGFTKDVYWAFFTIKNLSSRELRRLLEVDNPQIDCLKVYSVKHDAVLPTFATGDKYLFHQRPFINRNFIFPVVLGGEEAQSFLFKIDKRNSSLNFPLLLWDEESHREKDYVQNLGYGLYFGFILLCIVYSLLTFIFLRKEIYFWYFLWVVTSGLFVFTALGFSMQFLYPNVIDFNSEFRVYIEVLNFFTFIKFSQKFLRIEEYSARTNRFLNYVIYVLIALAIPLLIKLDVYLSYSNFLLPFANVLMLLTLFLIIYVSMVSFKKQKATVIFYYTAFAALLTGALLVMGIEFGAIAAENFPVNPFMAGSAIELFIFSLAITYGIKKVYDEKNELSIRIAKQQKDLLKAYVDGVERERERISRELHDDIGSRLSSLNRFVTAKEKDEGTKLQEQIEILCQDVRNMSHQLAPPSLKIAGLKQKVLELAQQLEHNEKLKVDIQFYDFPDALPDEPSQHIYRILQEAFNNVARHANATVLDLQFFGHEDEYVITLEDNGKGFNTSGGQGIGLQNIKARTESLQGNLEISSQPGRGTQLLLRIPKS